jgi:hypothetical protein
LYIESVDLGLDLAGTQLLVDLGVKYAADGTEYEVSQLIGDNDQFMANSTFDYLGGENAHYSLDHMNKVDATVLFLGENEVPRAFVYEGNTYRTISSTVVFGATADGGGLGLKSYLISEMVNYLLGISPVTAIQDDFTDILQPAHNYPNPFNRTTRIEYIITGDRHVKVDIFDQHGTVIKHLFEGDQATGVQRLSWDGTGDKGQRVSPGFYVYRIMAGGEPITGTMILVK